MNQCLHAPSLRQRQRGFTLTELAITLLVLAILAAGAFPAMREFGVRANVSSTTNDLVGALNLARAEAVKRGREVAVIAAAGNWSAGWTVQAGAEVIGQRGPVAENYRILGAATGTGAPADRVIFTGTGSLSQATAYDFSVCRPSFSPGDAESRRVAVAAAGTIRSHRGASGSPAGSCA